MHLTYDIRSHIDPHKIDQFNAEILDVVKRSTRLPVKGGGQRTGWFWGFENRNHPTVSKLMDWIDEIIPMATATYAEGEGGCYPEKMKIIECWSLLYNAGEGVMKHNHFPYTLAFVYYVNAPKGCSRTQLEYEEVEPDPGQMLVLQGNAYHAVPPSDVDGRCVVAGLAHYIP